MLELAEAVDIRVVEHIGDAFGEDDVLASPRLAAFTGGRCACGRPSLLLARCAGCIKVEADLAKEAASEDPEPPLPDGRLVFAAAGAPAPGWMPCGALAIAPDFAESIGQRMGVSPRAVIGELLCIGLDPSSRRRLPLFGGVPGRPYRMTFAYSAA